MSDPNTLMKQSDIAKMQYYDEKKESIITLRDHFAMTALQGLMPRWKSRGYTDKSAAVKAYKIADVMLEVRKATL